MFPHRDQPVFPEDLGQGPSELGALVPLTSQMDCSKLPFLVIPHSAQAVLPVNPSDIRT